MSSGERTVKRLNGQQIAGQQYTTEADNGRHCLKILEEGKLPEWKELEAPEIAVMYWKMPEHQRKMRDLLMYIRADEAKHREVNHTLGNLDQKVRRKLTSETETDGLAGGSSDPAYLSGRAAFRQSGPVLVRGIRRPL